MGTLGEKLRREREASGISLADIANHTRIGVRLLKAIEEEDFDQLPGGIYNKAFLRQYASYLGLDPVQILQEYNQVVGAAAQQPATLEEQSPPEASQVPLPTFGLPWKLAASVLIPIAAAALWLTLRAPNSTEPSPVQVSSSPPRTEPIRAPGRRPAVARPPEQAPSPAPFQPSARPQEAPVVAASEPVSSPAPSAPPPVSDTPSSVVAAATPAFSDAGADELVLEISAHSEVWLYITADGDQIWQGILQPNQTRQVQAAESIRLTVGNAGGVELMLNGKPLGELGRQGEVKRVSIAGSSLPTITP